ESVIKRTDKAIEKNNRLLDRAKTTDLDKANEGIIKGKESLLDGEKKMDELQKSEKPKSRSQRTALNNQAKKLNRYIENSKNRIVENTAKTEKLSVRYWHDISKRKLPELLKNKKLLEGVKRGAEETLNGVKVAGKILGPVGTAFAIGNFYSAKGSEE